MTVSTTPKPQDSTYFPKRTQMMINWIGIVKNKKLRRVKHFIPELLRTLMIKRFHKIEISTRDLILY